MKKISDNAVFATGGIILIAAVLFGIWSVFIRPFLQEPVIMVRPNAQGLTMAEVLEVDNVVLSDNEWKEHGEKLKTVFPWSITVLYGHIDREKYRKDFPDNASATWSSKLELPHAFQHSPISAEEFREKYVTRW
ncbi:MAG: hypothetical protein A2Z52_01930 [Candidatus Moranbacteria bacterium RBG_19FT_COMBO_42_6]|nr:MAG: hypothetical protein A2Z52_01930 [Candidatus Moranbacteria bacterium RBG_19FT_COMBO_42_6]